MRASAAVDNLFETEHLNESNFIVNELSEREEEKSEHVLPPPATFTIKDINN